METLPEDVLLMIGEHLPAKSMTALMVTCKSLYDTFTHSRIWERFNAPRNWKASDVGIDPSQSRASHLVFTTCISKMQELRYLLERLIARCSLKAAKFDTDPDASARHSGLPFELREFLALLRREYVPSIFQEYSPLTLEQIREEMARTDYGDLVPITNQCGFKQIFLNRNSGRVVLVSGFNHFEIADSFTKWLQQIADLI